MRSAASRRAPPTFCIFLHLQVFSCVAFSVSKLLHTFLSENLLTLLVFNFTYNCSPQREMDQVSPALNEVQRVENTSWNSSSLPSSPSANEESNAFECTPEKHSSLLQSTSKSPGQEEQAAAVHNSKITATLEDADLWHQFCEVGTEMIITKCGR